MIKRNKKVIRSLFSLLMVLAITLNIFPSNIFGAGDLNTSGSGSTQGTDTSNGKGTDLPRGEGVRFTFRYKKNIGSQKAGDKIFDSFDVASKEAWEQDNTGTILGVQKKKLNDKWNLPQPILLSAEQMGDLHILHYIEVVDKNNPKSGLTQSYFNTYYKKLGFINALGELISIPNLSDFLSNKYNSNWILEIEPILLYAMGDGGTAPYKALTWEEAQSQIDVMASYNLWDARTWHAESMFAQVLSVDDMYYTKNTSPIPRKAGERGIGLIWPDSPPIPPPVNYVATELEGEYVPSENAIRVKATYGIDGKSPFKCAGFSSPTLTPTSQFGNINEAMVTTEDNPLPTYQPGLTKTHIYVMWGKNNENSTRTIRNENNIPLYSENAVQLKNPEVEYISDISESGIPRSELAKIPGRYGQLTTQSLTAKQAGEFGSSELDLAGASEVSYEKDGWLYFKLPPIPKDETKLYIVSQINTPNISYLSPPMLGQFSRTTAGGAIENIDPLKNNWSFFMNTAGKLEPVLCAENSFVDNTLILELPLPTFNLKVGDPSVPNTPVKLTASYDTKEEKLCIIAPSIFDNFDGLDPKAEPILIDTANTITIKFKSAHKRVEFSNGDIFTDVKAGQIVKFSKPPTGSTSPLQQFTRYIPDWAYNPEAKWTSNVRYFGTGDVADATAILGTFPNLKEQLQYYDISGGGSNATPWCTPFPQPLSETTFEICYEVNPSLSPTDPDSTLDHIPDGESTYADNKACILITLGQEVNFKASKVSGEAIATALDSQNNPDYTKPYNLKVDGCGWLEKLSKKYESMDTDTRLYALPANPDGSNPFSAYVDIDNLTYEVPINSAKAIELIESKNDILSSKAKKSELFSHPKVKLADKGFCDTYTFSNLDGEFLIKPSESYKKIYIAYYVNPTNENPGIPPDLPKETTYADNFITGSVLITKIPPKTPPSATDIRNDPFLDCSIYVTKGKGNNRYTLANVANKKGKTNTENMQRSDITTMLTPGTEINSSLITRPYGSSFTTEMPKEPDPVSWGYKEYEYVYAHRKDYEGLCGDLFEITEIDYPKDYWADYDKQIKNQYVTKYMDVVDGKAVVKTQIQDVWKLEKKIEFHCACDGTGGDGFCFHKCEKPICCPIFSDDGVPSSNCMCKATYWEFYKLKPTQPTTYAVMFDNIYTNNNEKSRVFSTQGRGTAYDYLLAAGYGVGTVLRTRFLTDFQAGYSSSEVGGTGVDFSMEGWMKFSMSSSKHNGDGKNNQLTNGGYPLEQISKDQDHVMQVVSGQTVKASEDGVTLKHMYDMDIVSKEPNLKTYDGQFVSKGSNWIYETKGLKGGERGYLNLRYYMLEPKEQIDSQGNLIRQAYTNKNYPDAVKINSAGLALGNGGSNDENNTQGKLPRSYVASPLERAMGYVGLKVYDIAYINNRMPNQSPVSVGKTTYTPMMGVCYLGNLAIVGTYENDVWVRPADWK